MTPVFEREHCSPGLSIMWYISFVRGKKSKLDSNDLALFENMRCVCFSVPRGVIHRPGNASQIPLGWSLHLQWPKVYQPFAFLSVLHSIQFINSLERCFVVIGLIVALFFYLTLLNDFEHIRFGGSDFSSERKIHMWQDAESALVVSVWCLPFKFLIICCPASGLAVRKTLDDARFPKNVKCLQPLNLLIQKTQFLTMPKKYFYLQL